MRRIMLKSKIHRATVTGADPDYEGSLTLDPLLMKAADILPHEQVHIERAGLRFRIPAEDTGDDRLLYLGDDEDDVALEVMAVELADGGLYVIHAMELRKKYRPQYEEAKKWRE